MNEKRREIRNLLKGENLLPWFALKVNESCLTIARSLVVVGGKGEVLFWGWGWEEIEVSGWWVAKRQDGRVLARRPEEEKEGTEEKKN